MESNFSSGAIEIPLDKKKMALLWVGSLLLFSIGLWIVLAKPESEASTIFNKNKLEIAAYASVIFFGLTGIVISRKFFDTSPGLIIDHQGITDNSGALAAGFILWSDIDNISRFQVQKQDLLLIQVKNPEYYIQRQTHALKRKAMAINNKMYGSPVVISVQSLKITFSELYHLINARLNEVKGMPE